MKSFKIILSVIMTAVIFTACTESPKQIEKPEYAIVIHGGAGTILKKNMTPEKEAAYIEKMQEALNAGEAILKNGGSSLDAVEATIHIMEDSPLFNAGKGAVYTEAGENEMDASIMDGSNLMAGAVAGVKTVKHPISAARMVMEKSKHVMMAREGAEIFAEQQGLEIVDPSYFKSERRWNSYLRMKAKQESKEEEANKKHGTVGCVALDKKGNIAAGTSTGGMSMKMWGRIGDSPIIGAGTYANNKTCGVSSTGHGEFFIRNVVAYDISALMEYKGWSLEKSANYVVNEKLKSQGGTGGIVSLDKDGNIAMAFNTAGMYRGFIKSTGETEILIYGIEEE